MRMMVKATLPVAEGNQGVRNGSLMSKLQAVIQDLKPEAVYLASLDGTRTAIFILDMKEASEMPAIAEPFFQSFNAKVEIHPVMVPQDLMKAAPTLEAAVKKYA